MTPGRHRDESSSHRPRDRDVASIDGRAPVGYQARSTQSQPSLGASTVATSDVVSRRDTSAGRGSVSAVARLDGGLDRSERTGTRVTPVSPRRPGSSTADRVGSSSRQNSASCATTSAIRSPGHGLPKVTTVSTPIARRGAAIRIGPAQPSDEIVGRAQVEGAEHPDIVHRPRPRADPAARVPPGRIERQEPPRPGRPGGRHERRLGRTTRRSRDGSGSARARTAGAGRRPGRARPDAAHGVPRRGHRTGDETSAPMPRAISATSGKVASSALIASWRRSSTSASRGSSTRPGGDRRTPRAPNRQETVRPYEAITSVRAIARRRSGTAGVPSLAHGPPRRGPTRPGARAVRSRPRRGPR